MHFLKGLVSAGQGGEASLHGILQNSRILCIKVVEKASLTISQATVPSLAGSGSEVCCSGLQQWGSLLCSLPEKLPGCCIPTGRKNMKSLHRASMQTRGQSVGVKAGLTRMCDTVVIHVRVRPGPELAFGWPVPTRREDSGRCGKRCS